MSLAAALLALVAGAAAGASPPQLRLAVADRAIGVSEGVPGDQVLSLCEDSTGALWVGTSRGLARFAGPEPATFGIAEGLPSLVVTEIAEGPGGTIFVGTASGMARLTSEGLRREEPPAGDALRVRSIARGPSGDLFALLGDDTVLRLASDRWVRLALPEGGRIVAVSLAVDAAGRVFLATRNDGLLAFATGADGRSLVPAGRFAEPLFPLGRASSVLADGDGVVATASDAVVAISGSGATRRFPYPPGVPANYHSLARSGDGRLFLGSSAGVHELERGSGRLGRVASRRGLSGEPVVTLLVDRSGNVWSGTVSRGLVLLRTGSGLAFLEGENVTPRSLFAGPDGSFWTADSRSIYRLRLDAAGRLSETLLVRVRGGGPGALHAVVEDAAGRLLFATDVGILTLRPGTPPELAPDPRLWPIGDAYVPSLFRDGAGTVWAASRRGLYRLDAEAGTAVPVPLPAGLDPPRVAILDATDAIWISDQAGAALLRLAPRTRHPEPVVLPGSPAAPIENLARGPSGEPLVAWQDGSWALLDPATLKPRLRVGPKDTLAGIASESLVALGGGRYLAGVGGRVSIVTLDPPRIEHPSLSSAELDGADPRYVGAVPSPHGRIWLTTLGSVALFDPTRPEPPLSRLVVVARAGRPVPPDASLTTLELPHRPNALELVAAVPDPLAPRLVRYRFRFGASPFTDWSADPRVRLADLPGGTHLLVVEGTDRLGRPAGEPLRLRVVVGPLFTETLLFRLLLGLFFLVVGPAFYLGRVTLLKRRQRQLEQAVAERTEELRRANAALEEASLTDPLTGLKNRRFVAATIDATLAAIHRAHASADGAAQPAERVLFCLADIDHFKPVNDLHGHVAGDRALRSVARVLVEQVRRGATVARWGGEEFLIVERVESADSSPLLAERIRLAIATNPAEGHPPITVSLGLAHYPLVSSLPDLLTWEDMIRITDRALYAAKEAGRNRWCELLSDEEKVLSAAREIGAAEVAGRLREDPDGALALGWIRMSPAGPQGD